MTRPRRRALVAIGLGEFVDAYDLIVISGLFFALQSHFRLNSGEVAWLQAAAFFGSAVGALFFGDLADRIGRRRVFVLNLVAFVGLALVSAVVTEVWMLFVLRILIGVAIGADIAAQHLVPGGVVAEGIAGRMDRRDASDHLVPRRDVCRAGRRRSLRAGGCRVVAAGVRGGCVTGGRGSVAAARRCRIRPGGCWRTAESRTRPRRSSSSGSSVRDHAQVADSPSLAPSGSDPGARGPALARAVRQVVFRVAPHGGGVRDLDDRADPAERHRAERAGSPRSAPVRPPQ